MNELQTMWATAYQQYVDGSINPYAGNKSPSPIVLVRAREHADKVVESLSKLGDKDWIKCSESLPDETLNVLINMHANGRVVGYLFSDFFITEAKAYPVCAASHWQPLPEPPGSDN